MTSAVETANVVSALYQSCDWFGQNVDAFNTAQEGEVDALKNAKIALLGQIVLCDLLESES